MIKVKNGSPPSLYLPHSPSIDPSSIFPQDEKTDYMINLIGKENIKCIGVFLTEV